jgi:hypothetical protein
LTKGWYRNSNKDPDYLGVWSDGVQCTPFEYCGLWPDANATNIFGKPVKCHQFRTECNDQKFITNLFDQPPNERGVYFVDCSKPTSYDLCAIPLSLLQSLNEADSPHSLGKTNFKTPAHAQIKNGEVCAILRALNYEISATESNTDQTFLLNKESSEVPKHDAREIQNRNGWLQRYKKTLGATGCLILLYFQPHLLIPLTGFGLGKLIGFICHKLPCFSLPHFITS